MTAVRVSRGKAGKALPAVQKPPSCAPFDDSRKALAFALNHHQVAPPTAMMNAMMAAVRIAEKKRKKKTRKELMRAALLEADSPEVLLQREKEKVERKRTDLQRFPSLREQGLTKNDEAHLAGFILFHFSRLDGPHRDLLAGKLTIPSQSCNCRQPCCSGQRPTERWVQAVRSMADHVRLQAEVLKQPGKKGLGSQPLLRQLLIELYFLGGGPTLTNIASRAGVSLVTAARHRGWIHDYLSGAEEAAWRELDSIFDQAGITGPPP